MTFHGLPGLPPDPFAGDPADPAAEMDALDPAVPLDPAEREAVEQDLADIEEFQRILGPMGLRGVVIDCEDCDEEHYHDWEMMRSALDQLLLDGTVLQHEPAVTPSPQFYATWDYCRGYVDAVRDFNRARHGRRR